MWSNPVKREVLLRRIGHVNSYSCELSCIGVYYFYLYSKKPLRIVKSLEILFNQQAIRACYDRDVKKKSLNRIERVCYSKGSYTETYLQM